MRFSEFNEFPNLEEEDFDIKSAFSSSNPDPEEDILEEDDFNTLPPSQSTEDEDVELEEDIFEDYNIEDTLKRYNYNYGELIKILIFGINYDELMEILGECNISPEELRHPDAETFERLRKRIIHGKSKS